MLKTLFVPSPAKMSGPKVVRNENVVPGQVDRIEIGKKLHATLVAYYEKNMYNSMPKSIRREFYGEHA